MIIDGSTLKGDQRITADVVVVGSGSGGAVVARELAEEGHEVVVLEEGRHIDHTDYSRFRPSKVLRLLARSAGTTAALGIGDTPTINIMAGRCVGGSSIFTGGVCFRVPEAVHADWVKSLGVRALSSEAMATCYERVEEMIHVEEVPVEMRSRSTTLFDEGARKNGFPLVPLHRNTRDCHGCSRCTFGCPHGAKQSVDLTYLPRARELGTRVYADHLVDRLLIKGDRVVGVAGRIMNGRKRTPKSRFEVHANTVVLAAGTLHTPLILLRSGVGAKGGQVGRNMTLHPSCRVGAFFDEEVLPWKGALQSAWTDHFHDKGIALVSAVGPVGALAAGIPGMGPDYMERVSRLRQCATFGGMIHDAANGRVRRGWSREPFITYKMSAVDKAALIQTFKIIAQTYFDAGASEILLPIFGIPPIQNVDQLNKLVTDKLNARRIECLSFHPLGTCQLGTNPKRSVVKPSGETHDLKGLWLADGSVFPTSVGVNTQVPVMAMATRIAFELVEQLRHCGV